MLSSTNKSKNLQQKASNDNKTNLLSKIENKLAKLPKNDQPIYLKSQIDQFQSQYGNTYPLLFPLTEKYINLLKQSADEFYSLNKYDESLTIYKNCLKLTEPLPGSDWTKLQSWSKIRISLMNNIALLYQKLNKIEQAVEYIRLGINLEDTYGHKGDYDSRYNNIFFSAGNQLMLLEQYDEALKYLLKVENKIYDQFQVGAIIRRQKIDKNIDKDFLSNNPSQYVQLLNLICKAYIKLGNYTKSDVYYQRQSELSAILQKDKIVGGNRLNEGFNMNIIDNSSKKANTSIRKERDIKKADKAEEIDTVVNKTFVERPKEEKKIEIKDNISLTEGNNRKSKPKEEKKTKSKEKKLKQIVKEQNNYPPLDFKFKKPIFHNVKKLPLLELSSIPKSTSLGKLYPHNFSNKVTPANKKIRIKSKERTKKENKLTLSKEINQKIKEIQNTLNKQSTLKSITSHHSLSKKSMSKSNTLTSFQFEEEKKQSKKSISRQSSKESVQLPPIDKKRVIIRKITKKKFESEKAKKDIVMLSEDEKESDNEYGNLKPEQDKKKEPYVATRKISDNLTKEILKKKTRAESMNIRKVSNISKDPEERNNIRAMTKINKSDFKPEKIDIDSIKAKELVKDIKNTKIEERTEVKKITNPKIKNLSKSLYNLIITYYNQTHLLTSNQFDKRDKKHHVFALNDICLVKTLNDRIYKIYFSLPFLSIPQKQKNDKNPSLPFISVDVFFESFDRIFQTKYTIKIMLDEQLKTSSEELQEDIITSISSLNKDINLSWSICLFYFENWFTIFKSKYEANIGDNANEVNKMFYRTYIQNLNEYISNITKWESKNILMNRENKYINLLLKYFYILLKYISIQKNVIGNIIRLKNLNETMILNSYRSLCEQRNGVINRMNILNKAGNKMLLKSMIYYY